MPVLPMVPIFCPAFTSAVAHQRGVVVRIGGNKVFAVLNHDQVAVAAQLVADVHHFALGGSVDRLAAFAGDVDALVATI